MRYTRLALLVGAAVPALLPAQSSAAYGGEIFWAHTTSLPGAPGLGGFAATMQAGGIGVRAGAAFNRRYDPYGVTDMPWTVDGDVFINSGALGQVIGIALGGITPVGFIGVGQQGITDADGRTTSVPTYSYGGGASLPLFAGLRVSAELRQRRAFSTQSDVTRLGMGTGRELRLALTFGGRSARTRSSGAAGRGGTTPAGGGVVLAGGAARSTASASARRVLATGEEYLGVPYVYGGEDPQRGIDCSAFTQLVFRRNGITLPRTSRQQATVGSAVLMDYGVIRPGDLLFFAGDGTRIDHVAIYAGDQRILHATSSGAEVRYDDLGSERGAWFVNNLVAVRRVLSDDGGSLVSSLEAARRLAPVLDRGDLAPRPKQQ